MYLFNGAEPFIYDDRICTVIQYSQYGNASFSSFVFAFTIMYVCLPMFSNSAPNFWIFSGLLVYFLFDVLIRVYRQCIVNKIDLFLNILMGAICSCLIVTLMYAGGSSKYLFFNEVASNKEVCYKPDNQTFKCAVYKNGELVGDL
jgi:peptidoglycan/LPS O-acetylase OafA/YrhL